MSNKTIKKLALISTSLMLTGTVVATVPSQTVDAVSNKTFSKYSKKFNRVVVTDPIWVYKIYPRYPMYKTKYVKAYKLKPGDTPIVRHRGVDWGWTVGKSYRYCILKDSFSWFDGYSKYKWVDRGLLDGSMKDEHFAYKFTWKQYCQLIKAGIYTTVHPKKLWNSKIKKMIERWKPETDNS